MDQSGRQHVFKLGVEALNKASPNSSANITIICCFAAKDSQVNLATGTAHINADIKSLAGRKWKAPDGRKCSLRLFSTSDYSPLCQWFGISVRFESTRTFLSLHPSSRSTQEERISNKKVNDGDIGTQDNVTNGSMELNMTPVEMKKDVQKR
ncbi:Hypp7627 [Branchiostoma lanceolatum]|uniref:Hypp7627 protein n=1 Tax=Branchiostoma lanceolatum TaxID=7740 RepID=A0A8K0ECI3_BRALA|nr:Hypp7627 [Branchiostoma lanceolatum]